MKKEAGLPDPAIFLKMIPNAEQQQEKFSFGSEVGPDGLEGFNHMITYRVPADPELVGNLLVAELFVALQLEYQFLLGRQLVYGFPDQLLYHVEVV